MLKTTGVETPAAFTYTTHTPIAMPTLRDQIAMSALPAIITLNGNSTTAEEDAVIAYNYATAMLKARGE